MKEIKLSGREASVLRQIEQTGTPGAELVDRTNIVAEDLCDILNGLAEVGYVEAFTPEGAPILNAVTAAQFPTTVYETNPSYGQQLREAMTRR